MASGLNARRRSRGPAAIVLGLITLLSLAGVALKFAPLGTSQPNPTEPLPTWESIEAAVARGDRAGVSTRLKPWLEAHPEDGKALLTLATLRSGENRFDDFRDTIGRIKPGDPSWAKGRMFLGQVEMTLKRGSAALPIFEGLAAADPSAIPPRKALVYLYSLVNRAADARSILWQLYQIDPQPEMLLDLTTSLFKIEHDVRAMGADLEAFAKASPADPFFQSAWGLALYWKGRTAEAASLLEAAVSKLENDPVAAVALLDCRKQLGQAIATASAEGLLGPPRSEHPGEHALWYRQAAQIAALKNNRDESLALLKKAVAINPRDRIAHHRLSRALAEANQPDDAKTHADLAKKLATLESTIKKAAYQLEVDKFPARGCEHLADLCQEAGLLAEERAWREWALTKDPTLTACQTRLGQIPAKFDVADLPTPLGRPLLRARPLMAKAASTTTQSHDASNIHFEDISANAGVEFRYDSGARGDLFVVDTMGGGVALIDVDSDGFLDIYFINGCRLPIDPAKPIAPNRLFRNKGDGTFEDSTAKAGVGGKGYGMGAAVGDYDNDGHDDLFVTGFGQTVLYHNRGDGTFEDVTDKAGVSSNRWTTAAGFGDLDSDGDLDLMVVTYVDADSKTAHPCRDQSGGAIHCSPGYFAAQFDQLFRNNGDGTFTDISREAGIEVANGRGLGLAIFDFDGDGKLDLFVANDASPNFAFRNLGGLKFEEVGMESGLGVDGSGKATASMGVVANDLNNDGRIDIFHTNFLNEGSTLRLNLGKGLFVDATTGTLLDAPSRAATGFGAAALDLENDGKPDLFVANGHVDDQTWVNSPMAQPAHLFANLGNGAFRPLGAEVAPYFASPHVGRGVAAGDLDNDGLVDLVVIHRDAPASILKNRAKPSGNWLKVNLKGTKSGKTPIGAKLVVKAGPSSWTDWVTSGTSYLSANDRRNHFGLGNARSVDSLEIVWPSGHRQTLRDLKANQIVTITEGK